MSWERRRRRDRRRRRGDRARATAGGFIVGALAGWGIGSLLGFWNVGEGGQNPGANMPDQGIKLWKRNPNGTCEWDGRPLLDKQKRPVIIAEDDELLAAQKSGCLILKANGAIIGPDGPLKKPDGTAVVVSDAEVERAELMTDQLEAQEKAHQKSCWKEIFCCGCCCPEHQAPAAPRIDLQPFASPTPAQQHIQQIPQTLPAAAASLPGAAGGQLNAARSQMNAAGAQMNAAGAQMNARGRQVFDSEYGGMVYDFSNKANNNLF